MRIPFALCSLVLLAALPLNAARKKDGPWPPFQVGVTGIMARPDKETIVPVTVAEVTPGTPAEGKLQVGDVLVAVNGVLLEAPDPRPVLGGAITAAEAGGGKLNFIVERGGERRNVTVTIPELGSYSETWPVDCPKTDKIVAAAAKRSMAYLAEDDGRKLNRTTAMHCMFLLSTGEEEHLGAVRELMRASCPEMTNVRGHTWNNGYMLIALGEYFLRTGDKVVLPVMQVIVNDSFERDCVGGWGHWDYLNPGYVRSGLVNAAGGGLFTGIVLARECGIEMKDADFEKTLRYFYRFAGYGGAPYGDQRPSGGGSTNGKSGMVSVGLSMLNEPYAAAAKAVALEQADSYDGFEGGHTGNFTNVMWRALSVPNVPADKRPHYRRHQDKLRWYYELCRQPNGGFRMLPAHMKTPRYATEEWGMTIALSYTAGWRKLRVTGASPGTHSVIKPVRLVYPKDPDFHSTACAEGCGLNDFAAELKDITSVMPWAARKPFYSHRSIKKGDPEQSNEDQILPPVETIAKHFRHWNPVVRQAASCAIGYHGDKALPEIEKAIRSGDARVRQAGLRGLTGFQTFFMERSPFTYTEKGRVRMVPLIAEVLENSDDDPWVLDSALWAMSAMPPVEIVKQFDLITPYLKSDEWWLRTSAFLAICETGADAAPVVPDLIECFVREEHGWPREFYHRVLKTLLREDQPKLSRQTRGQLVKLLGDDIVGGNYPRDHAYAMRGNWFYEHRNSHILTSFEPDELVLVAAPINQILANMGDPELVKGREGMTALWILNGDKFGGEGLLNILEKMDGRHRAAFMPGLKALLAGGLDVMCGSGKQAKANAEPLEAAKAKARAMLDAYEKHHTSVTPSKSKKIDYDGSLHD